MSDTSRSGVGPVGWSIALHVALGGLLYLGLSLPRQDQQESTLPIDAVIVDDAVLQAAGRERRQDVQRVAEETRRAEQAAEARRIEEERLAQQEQQEQEEQARRLEEQERLAAEQEEQEKAAAEEAAQRQAEAETEAKRKADEQAAEKAAAEKKRASQEARLRQEREADLRARLAAEEERSSAGFQSLRASYVAAIQAHVEQRWFEPPGIGPGMSCTVLVSQIPGGEVIGMRFGACNAAGAVRQSIEAAVRNASPLPAPPEPTLFEREVELVFTPKESRR
ncbi:MAG: cell envelope integrity protein TolA [Steroidobacteraceae bacterium]